MTGDWEGDPGCFRLKKQSTIPYMAVCMGNSFATSSENVV